jgi:branched-chain amino acid transport system ATP-binding protein
MAFRPLRAIVFDHLIAYWLDILNMLLVVDAVSAGYGSLRVMQSIDMNIAAGQCVAVLGWNGTGKSTLLKTIAGLVRPYTGNIFFAGESIVTLPAHRRVQKGIALVPEGRRLFAGMTVRENLLVGAHTVGDQKVIQQQLDRVFELFPILADRRQQIVGTLSGGEQQMCAISRAMMSSPRLMLVDELSLGLAPSIVEHLIEALAKLRRLGGTVLLVEQDPDLAIRISDRVCIMQGGRITRQLETTAIVENPRLRQDLLRQ